MITVTVWKSFKLNFYRTYTNGDITLVTFPDNSFQTFPADKYEEVIDKVSRGLDVGADFATIEPIYRLKAYIPLERIKEGLSPSEERRSNFAWVVLKFGQCENYEHIKEKLKCDYYLKELKLVEENELESILEKESQFPTVQQYIKVEDVAMKWRKIKCKK